MTETNAAAETGTRIGTNGPADPTASAATASAPGSAGGSAAGAASGAANGSAGGSASGAASGAAPAAVKGAASAAVTDAAAAAVTDAPKPQPQGAFRRAMHRLTSPEHVLDAERRQEEAVEQGGTPVGRCADREQVCVVGQLRTVTIQPRGQSPALQAELWDGSGTVDLVWIGRRKIAGIEPGRVLRAEGRITQRDGRRVMFNPRYELRPAKS